MAFGLIDCWSFLMLVVKLNSPRYEEKMSNKQNVLSVNVKGGKKPIRQINSEANM
jgi:hypothetical protein